MFTRLRLFLLSLLILMTPASFAQASGDAIVGRWKATEKTLTIEIYKAGNEYRAKIIDFTDHHSEIPAAQRRDEKNPDEKLRGRPLLGIDVLRGMHYDDGEKAWTDGHVYDVSSGKEYSAELHLEEGKTLNVRAFKGVTFLGKTMSFVRS